MRLINADAKELQNRIERNFGPGGRFIVRNILNDAPTVDAVEVVRCKDCVHMKERFGARYCEVWTMFNGDGDDGFCNYGERRADDVEAD